jgi:hypothetical protein
VYCLQSVTFEELHASLAAANPAVNLSGLLPWLSNDAPPTLTVSSSWDSTSSTLSVTVQRMTQQENPPLVPLKVCSSSLALLATLCDVACKHMSSCPFA